MPCQRQKASCMYGTWLYNIQALKCYTVHCALAHMSKASPYLSPLHPPSQFVTKRRNSWACIGNPNPEQETSKGTHAQETSAYQRRPTTQYAAQGSNPPMGRYPCS